MYNLAQIKKELIPVIESSSLVYKVIDYQDYLTVQTEIMLGATEDFLNLYIVFEENGVCISDSNELYAFSVDYFDIEEKSLKEFAKIVGLDYENNRYTKFINRDNVVSIIESYDRLVKLILPRE